MSAPRGASDADRSAEHAKGFSQRVSELSEPQLLLLRSLWDVQDADARQAAWEEVRRLAQSTGRADELRELETGLAQWSTGSREPAEIILGSGVMGGFPAGDVRRAALPPVLDAAAALVFERQLTPDAFAALIAPWKAMEAGDEGEAEFEVRS